MDPIETSKTAAYLEGMFLRKLFTFKLRTGKIFSLFVMLVFGVAVTVFIGYAIFAFTTTPSNNSADAIIIVAKLILWFVFSIGIALLINFMINVLILTKIIKPDIRLNNTKKKEINKKIPKHRKDYK